MRERKLLFMVLLLTMVSIFVSCSVNNVSMETAPTQINFAEYDLKYMIYKELSQDKKEEISEYLVLDILIASPIPLDELIGKSYSIITAKLKSAEQDSTIKNLRYYEFEVQENIKGNADKLSSINIKIYDYDFGEAPVRVTYKDDGYIPPYELGAEYLLFIGKHQYVYAKKDKIEYYLEMSAFSKLNGENIICLMQQTRKLEGAYPATIGKLKEKVAELVEEPKDNGLANGNDFIESENIPEIIDFAPVIVEVKKKSKNESDSVIPMDIYELEIVTIHKGEVPDSFSIQADAKNGIDNAEEFLLFLSPPANGSRTYMLASPQGSVIPLSDTERYSQAIKYLYPEDKGGIWDKVKSFFSGLFGK